MFFSTILHRRFFLLIILLLYSAITMYAQTAKEISAQLNKIELSFFHQEDPVDLHKKLIPIKELLLDRIEILQTQNPTLDHLLLARALYLGAMLQPDQYTIADIFQAVMIEEALIPLSMGLQYNTDLSNEDKIIFKELLISFYITQARYYFFTQSQVNQALASLSFALPFSDNPIFILYEMSFIQQANQSQTALTISPTKELQRILQQPKIHPIDKTFIYLFLAILDANQQDAYLEIVQSLLQNDPAIEISKATFMTILLSHIPAPMIPFFIFSLFCSDIPDSDQETIKKGLFVTP
ncbi:hypothetical protein PVA45_00745 [Entomospira entomophila]|uniref:Uncharacterized protein n=1 Tax=Entomospira entomophila TaxID=2719988 RepID=A0A968KQU0_9SPIO|nr:hypothetical protein [Entomospira entomophilus]NIZ40048.1 hypothetical protein [Entomospira entomophilus]WDI35609.1 hypothetical protein PVA45_00745 [Entomospira entomophilus]